MDKKFCDSCGKEISPSDSILVVHGKRERLFVQFYVVDEHAEPVADKDVCRDCVVAEACSPGSPRARKKGGAQ